MSRLLNISKVVFIECSITGVNSLHNFSSFLIFLCSFLLYNKYTQYNTIQYNTINIYCAGLGNLFIAFIKNVNTGVKKYKNTDKFIIKTVCKP